jgi:hypothetical protein
VTGRRFLQVVNLVGVLAIAALLLWVGTSREQAGEDAEARAAAAAARAESAATAARVRVQRLQTIDTFLSLRSACARGNVRSRQTNAAIVELRAFVLDAAEAREATGDPAVAERYRMRAARLTTLPLVDCSEAYPLPRGVTAAQARRRAANLATIAEPPPATGPRVAPRATPSRTRPRTVTPPRPSPTPRPAPLVPAPSAPPPAAAQPPAATPSPTPPTPAAPEPTSPTGNLPIIGPVVEDALPVVPRVVDPALCALVACPAP